MVEGWGWPPAADLRKVRYSYFCVSVFCFCVSVFSIESGALTIYGVTERVTSCTGAKIFNKILVGALETEEFHEFHFKSKV